jgi:glycosyltransferase involved in cell wall biosynthesis
MLRTRHLKEPYVPELIAPLVTPMVITFNEAPNIARCMERLRWAPRILVVDSGSTDGTIEIVRRYPQVELVTRPFDDFASQCNYGLTLVDTPWVLSLDADYELSQDLVDELHCWTPGAHSAFEAAFVYRINGCALRASLYPPRRVLYQKNRARYRNEGHGHRVEIDGTVGRLRAPIYHDDRKPLSRWLDSQQRYAAREAEYLCTQDPRRLRGADRLRLMGWPAPIAVFVYTLIWKGCIIDGWPGWFYVLQRTLAEIMIGLEIVRRRLGVG